MEPDQLRKDILMTIAYYDVLDYPVTVFEIWKYLSNSKQEEAPESVSLAEVVKGISDERLKRLVESRAGFFFLKGRSDLVGQRIRRQKISQGKLKKLMRAASILRLVPFVRMIAITGRLAMKNAEPQSDLDILVVLKAGKIFTGRTLVTILVHLLGMRRYGKKVADRICLNYFITTRSLEISMKDMFAASEYFFIFPIFGFKTFRKFQKHNAWIGMHKPNYTVDLLPNIRMLRNSRRTRWIRRIGEWILKPGIIEDYLASWQIKRIQKNPLTHAPGSMVVADERALIFLPDPHGPKVFDAFKERLDGISRT